MSKFEDLFESLNKHALYPFNSDEDFRKVSFIHDWRHYVDEAFTNDWATLTEREKKIIFINCETIATNEEWD